MDSLLSLSLPLSPLFLTEQDRAGGFFALSLLFVCVAFIIIMEICKVPTRPVAESAEQASYNTHDVHRDGKCYL